jgi:hypothetical protein
MMLRCSGYNTTSSPFSRRRWEKVAEGRMRALSAQQLPDRLARTNPSLRSGARHRRKQEPAAGQLLWQRLRSRRQQVPSSRISPAAKNASSSGRTAPPTQPSRKSPASASAMNVFARQAGPCSAFQITTFSRAMDAVLDSILQHSQSRREPSSGLWPPSAAIGGRRHAAIAFSCAGRVGEGGRRPDEGLFWQGRRNRQSERKTAAPVRAPPLLLINRIQLGGMPAEAGAPSRLSDRLLRIFRGKTVHGIFFPISHRRTLLELISDAFG